MNIVKFNPVFKNYIWGGTKLNSKYNKNSGFEKTAESWKLSGQVHPDDEMAKVLEQMAKKAMKLNLNYAMWKLTKGNVDKVIGKTVFLADDDKAYDVIDVYLSYLSEGIVNMFQPEVICLGGGVSGAGERILEPDI